MNRPPAIFCIGRNYAAHGAEMGTAPTDTPQLPTVFMKNPAAICASGDTIVIPPICDEHGPQVDFEGELAVVLCCDCRDVLAAQAGDCIGGYAVANDVTARWWQKHGSGGQWIRGKSFDTFCPITEPIDANQITDPQALTIRTWVSGELMQEATTADMLLSVHELIAELSRGTTLLKGTLLLTGTPEGVGAARQPQRFLRDGDDVVIEIDGVGRLQNPVRA